MICFVVESQKEWNDLRSDRAPTFRPDFLKIGLYVSPAPRWYILKRQRLLFFRAITTYETVDKPGVHDIRLS